MHNPDIHTYFCWHLQSCNSNTQFSFILSTLLLTNAQNTPIDTFNFVAWKYRVAVDIFNSVTPCYSQIYKHNFVDTCNLVTADTQFLLLLSALLQMHKTLLLMHLILLLKIHNWYFQLCYSENTHIKYFQPCYFQINKHTFIDTCNYFISNTEFLLIHSTL